MKMSFAIVLLYLLLFYSFVASAAPNTQIATQHNNELSISSSSNTLKNINNNNVPDSDKSSILVITADGAVSSLDSQTGKENWSLRTGKPLVSSAAAVSTEAPSLIPSLDGSGEIFYLQAGEMKKLPVTVHDIVSSSPLFHSDTETETLFIGSKSTSIFAVDPITGRLLKIMSNQPNNAFGSGDDVYTYDDCPAGLPERTLLLGRADYFIRAVDPISGMERWNITVGEYIPYLTSRDKANTQSDASQLISQGNWLHSVTLGSKKVEWSAAIQAPPVTAFTLSGNTQLQKLGFAHTVPSLPSSSSSSSSVVAANSQVFVAVIEDQPFATSNPTIVFHEPYLLPSLPSPATPHDPAHSTASQIDGDPSTSLINPSPPSSTAPIIPGLYPVVEFEFRNNGTIVVDGRGEGGKVSEFSSLEKFAEIIAHQFLVPVLATVLACVTVGGYLLVKSRSKKGKGRRNKKNIVEESKESEKEKVEEDKKKKKIETVEKEKNTPNLTQNEDNNNANNNGEVNSGSDGNTPNKQNGKNNNTPKKKAPKRKPRPSAQLSYFSNAKGKAKKNEEVEEEEGEKEGEQEKVEDNKEEGDKPITSTKSTRITTEDGKTRIGKLEITQTILGYGSGGTIVFEGFLHGRRVAVKRMLAQFMDLAQQEISLLIHSDEHPNVVRYHAKEEDNEFVYLALSYCPYTLNHVIDRSLHSLANFEFRKQKIEPYPYPELEGDVMRIIHELVTGVAHLHMLNIVHRDIKPQNTLLDPSNRVKISDMGLAKKLEIDQSSFSGKDTGSFGWKAPEVLTGGEGRLTKAVDIFSLGCLIYYILTKSHPFGDKYEREANILLGRSDLKEVEGWPEAHHLIRSMIQINPDARPTAQEILHHPFFWTTQQKMHFLIAASDYVEFEKPTAPVVIALDLRIGEVVRVSKTHSIHDSMSDWLSVLDPLLVANLIRYRQYKTTSLRDLLRVMRNKYNHFRDLPPDLQVVLGPVPDGFYGYFRIRFPRLLLCVFEVVREFFGNEDVFGTYFYHRPVKDKDIKDN